MKRRTTQLATAYGLALCTLAACGSSDASNATSSSQAATVSAVANADVPVSLVGSDTSGYPRAIRVTHSLNSKVPNGTLIATAMAVQGGDYDRGYPIYLSSDDGTSWSAPLTFAGAGSAPGSCCQTLFEMPQQLGAYPAGTLLLAATTDGGVAIASWMSEDDGYTWTFHGNVATGGQGNTKGLWEPEFAVDSSGNLVCYFSDERYESNGYNQLLGHVVSTDGGLTWGDETYDVAVNDGDKRPGMARVTKLPDSSYIMAYEVCGTPGCAISTRTSVDGDHWGDATSLGARAQTAEGAYFYSAPELVWSPAGGANGSLWISGKYLNNSTSASGTVAFVTSDLSGQGGWQEAPLPWRVTYGDESCGNYSSVLLPSRDGQTLLFMSESKGSGDCRVFSGSGPTPTTGSPGGSGTVGPIGAPGGKCVDVSNSNSTSGTAVQLWDCNGTAAQSWTVASDGTLRALGKCLDIVGDGTANGTEVELWDCNGVGGQRWVTQSNGSLLNPQSNRCLDDPAGNTANGTPLQIWDCNNEWPQVYRLP